MCWRLLNIWELGHGWPSGCAPIGSNTIHGPTAQKTGGATPWQIMYIHLFRQFLLPQTEFWCGANVIGSSIKFPFHPCKERPKRTLYTTWASFLVHATPRLRGGLKLELLWVSTLATRIELVLSLLLDLDTLARLLHAIRQSWSYSWVSCLHQVSAMMGFMVFLSSIIMVFIVLVQRMCAKIKDKLVPNVIWHWETLRIV